MNHARHYAAALCAAAALVASGAQAAPPAAAPPPPPAPAPAPAPASHDGMEHGMEHRMGMHHAPGMMLMQAYHRLGLSEEQHAKLRELMRSEHERMAHEARGHGGAADDLVALGNPADPRHAAAVEAAKQRAAARVQQQADFEQKAWEVLTPEQKARLPKVLEDMQKHLQEHLHGGQPEDSAP